MQVLEVPGEDALPGGEQRCVDAAHVFHFPGRRLQQIGEDPADLFQSQQRRHLLHLAVLRVLQQFDCVLCALLGRLVDRHDARADAQRNVGRGLVSAVKESDALVAGDAPVVEEAIDDALVLEHHVVDVPVGLRVQRDG